MIERALQLSYVACDVLGQKINDFVEYVIVSVLGLLVAFLLSLPLDFHLGMMWLTPSIFENKQGDILCLQGCSLLYQIVFYCL